MAPSKQQVANSLKKWFKTYDFDHAIKRCENEAQTRELLIEPIINALGYEKLYHWVTESLADVGGRKGLRVDYALAPQGKDAVILIEAKHHTNALGNREFQQLSTYFTNVSSARVGILTNGVLWKFFAGDGSTDKLHHEPFLTFNCSDWNDSDIDGIAKFHIGIFKSIEVIQEAEEIYLLSKFDQALFEELSNPSDEFIGSILRRMGFGRATKQRMDYVRSSINYLSLKDAYDKIVSTGALSPDDGIVTTDEELRAYQAVKTLVATTSKKMASIIDNITYKDNKGSFSVLWRDNFKNVICAFKLGTKKRMFVSGNWYDIDSIDQIVDYKNEIVESVKGYFES
jgi:hypothetical protein